MKFGGMELDLERPQIMAILNVTPDSFFDGGQCYRGKVLDVSVVCARAQQMLNDGASIIDVGGESTRPGAEPVSEQQECDRVLPVVEALQDLNAVVSVDTSSPKVMREAAKLGAGLINDVRALRKPGAIQAAVEAAIPVCLMHMQGSPKTMQNAPSYSDPVAEVLAFLEERKAACIAAGLEAESILVDPGIGFGKADDHNLILLHQLNEFSSLGPVLLGVSRKSLFGRLLGRPLDERLAGSLATAVIGMQNGAKILRVHDVAATHDAVRMFELINNSNSPI